MSKINIEGELEFILPNKFIVMNIDSTSIEKVTISENANKIELLVKIYLSDSEDGIEEPNIVDLFISFSSNRQIDYSLHFEKDAWYNYDFNQYIMDNAKISMTFN